VGHIEENFCVRSGRDFPKHGAAHLITRQQFVDESLTSIIDDVGALTAQSFSQKKSRGASQTQHGRMKLDELHISQFRSGAIRGSESVTGRGFGIRTLRINLRSSAGCEKCRLPITARNMIIMLELNSDYPIIVDDQFAEEGERHDADVRI